MPVASPAHLPDMIPRKYREDLMPRIRRAIEKYPKPTVSAKDLSELLGEPTDQILACFQWLLKWDALGRPIRPMASKQQARKVRRTAQPDPACAEWPIVGWVPPPEADPVPDGAQCPRCGRPIKRRHSRGKFHDPDRCMMNNIRDIHDV